MGIAVVDADRHVQLAREVELPDEDAALQGATILILLPVIVEADLADGNDLRHVRPARKDIVLARGHLKGLLRVDADTGVEALIGLGQVDSPLRGLERVAHVDHARDANGSGSLHRLLDIRLELRVIEMRVRVDEFDAHQRTSVPAGMLTSSTLRPLPSLAARIIPSETTPRSLAGLRLTTSTTCLPTSSSGW